MKSRGPRWAGSLLAAILSCQTLAGCAPENATPEEDLQSICARSKRLQDVERYDGSFGVPTAFVNRHRLAVGLLRWRSDLRQRYAEPGDVEGAPWCTGTLIDDDLLLTAGHCLDPKDSATSKLPHEKGHVELTPWALARELVVQFRYEEAAEPQAASVVTSVNVLRLEEYRSGELDYAILRLSDRPGLQNGTARISARDSRPGERIAILQHPMGEPMKIGAGTVARLQGSTLTYDTIDTLGGSSGSGILDAETGKLVGVHTNGGCTKSGGGENFGVAIRSITAVSPILQGLVDHSKDFLVGDWDNDGLADLAVFNDGCLYPDANHDGAPDDRLKICPADAKADQYFVGNWELGGPSRLGWRHGNRLYLDTNPQQPLSFDDPPFEVLVADWDGDGRSDLGIRKGACIAFDTDLNGELDTPGYCYGNGYAEDEYLVGRWDGAPSASVAVRRGTSVLIDANRDGRPDDPPRLYGYGGDDDQYLVGDWDGDQRADLAVRRGMVCLMNHDAPTGPWVERRGYRDFWSEP